MMLIILRIVVENGEEERGEMILVGCPWVRFYSNMIEGSRGMVVRMNRGRCRRGGDESSVIPNSIIQG